MVQPIFWGYLIYKFNIHLLLTDALKCFFIFKFNCENVPCSLLWCAFSVSVGQVLNLIYLTTTEISLEIRDLEGHPHKLPLPLTYHHYLPPFCASIVDVFSDENIIKFNRRDLFTLGCCAPQFSSLFFAFRFCYSFCCDIFPFLFFWQNKVTLK